MYVFGRMAFRACNFGVHAATAAATEATASIALPGFEIAEYGTSAPIAEDMPGFRIQCV